jgi:hypothetical protein
MAGARTGLLSLCTTLPLSLDHGSSILHQCTRMIVSTRLSSRRPLRVPSRSRWRPNRPVWRRCPRNKCPDESSNSVLMLWTQKFLARFRHGTSAINHYLTAG